MPPSVIVVIPYYNNAATVIAAMASARAQPLAPTEIILVDDGSDDEQAGAPNALPPDVTMVWALRNRGPGAARMLGTLRSTAEWVAYLHADDVWLPEKPECQMAFLGASPELDAAHSGTTVWRKGVDSRQCVEKPPRLPPRLVCEGHNILASAFIIRRACLLALGNWADEWFVPESLDLSFLMMAAGVAVGFQPEALVRFRHDDHGRTTSDRWRILELHFSCVAKHRGYIRDVVGVEGLTAFRTRYVRRFGHRSGRLAGRLIAGGARLINA